MASRKPQPLLLTGDPLTLADVEQVARHGRGVEIAPQGLNRLERSHQSLRHTLREKRAIYGVNTGFGSFAQTRIEDDELEHVQHNLIRSHSAGVDRDLAEGDVRATMLLLAASLCRGHSGVRPVVAKTVVDALNARITPVVPALGSVGASGDLAPLAHIALALTGEGEVRADGARRDSSSALADAGIEPLTLGPKEGLALINGTHFMAARAALTLRDARRMIDAALLAAAMSIDACRATDAFLDDRVQKIRNHPGQSEVARRIRAHLEGSEIIPSHRDNDPRVQDPYSLRCVAPVLGAALAMLEHCESVISRELGAVTDNPLVFPADDHDGADVISAGNFHGMPIALAMDALTMALTHVAGISERRMFYLLSARDPESHVNAHLSPHPGLHSGLMIVQYTAAACCNEMITLSTPASVSNLPTSAGIEDYNSFGPRACAKASRAVELARWVIAIELLCSGEAIEYHRPLESGRDVEAAHARIRAVVPRLTADRPPAPDIEAITRLIASGELLSR